MNTERPHDIVMVRPGRDPLPANYRPVSARAVDKLRAMTEDERAEWLARNPITVLDMVRIEQANMRRAVRERKRAANIERARAGK